MCGIAGILGRVDRDANHAALRRMSDRIAHRGPDSAGFWTSSPDESGHGCMFAHRRLSILDLSAAADQPMTDPGTGQTIVFNGEIYNFHELRGALQSEGQTFQSTGDTAVILRMLGLKGAMSVQKFRGMFAFALWDNQFRKLTVARDPLGIKPLYVCRNPDPAGEWSLLFASEVRAILASGLIGTPKLNPDAVSSVVWNGFVMGPQTAVRGIESLEPGHVQVLDARGRAISGERYWSMPRADVPQDATTQSLEAALAESVKLHLVSDVPLGIFLSGGIDSSAVANLAQRAVGQSGGQVNTFTLAFEEQAFNEGQFARQIAGAIGTKHHEIMLTEAQFVAQLQTAIDTIDQPTFDGLNSYYISKAVRDAGLTVALVGTGGDELFGGYTSFRALPTMLTWNRRSRFVPTGAKVLAAQLAGKMLAPGGSTPAQTRWAKLPDMVRARGDLIELYQLAYALFLPAFQEELLLNPPTTDSGLTETMQQRLRQEIDGHAPLVAISAMEQRCFLGERLLRDTDAASMAVSLETRLPLVDHVLLEHVNRIPLHTRYQPLGRKQLLRDVGLRGLDPSLFERPKSGFVLPFDRWIRAGLGKQMGDTMRDERLARAVGLNGATVARLWEAFQNGSPGLYWSRVWALYILIHWCQRQGVLL